MRKRMIRPVTAGVISILAAVTLLAGSAGSAPAATGGAPTPSGSAPPRGSGSGAPSTEPSSGPLTLIAAKTSPRKSFYFGYRQPRLRFTLGSPQAHNDIRVDVVNASDEVVRSFYREDVAPNQPYGIRWDGTTAAGKPARNGKYSFRISPQTPAPAARRATPSTALSLGFTIYGFTFPVLGRHDYGGSGGRFGSGRSGHAHQGQDVMAACGVPLVAARGGRVKYNAYHGSAGNYIVIDGRGTPNDFAYMHLAEPSPLKVGEVVRTGQPIGAVGNTGNSSACHLHFEIWDAPGWYEGGSPFDPYSLLQKWDRYS